MHYTNWQPLTFFNKKPLWSTGQSQALTGKVCLRACKVLYHTPLLVPTSSVIGRQLLGGTPAQAVYRASLPIGMPMPYVPRSPRPSILSPSVTTIACTVHHGDYTTHHRNQTMHHKEYTSHHRAVFFSHFTAAEPYISATITHGTPCNDKRV